MAERVHYTDPLHLYDSSYGGPWQHSAYCWCRPNPMEMLPTVGRRYRWEA